MGGFYDPPASGIAGGTIHKEDDAYPILASYRDPILVLRAEPA
jgi:hypothetical protein